MSVIHNLAYYWTIIWLRRWWPNLNFPFSLSLLGKRGKYILWDLEFCLNPVSLPYCLCSSDKFLNIGVLPTFHGGWGSLVCWLKCLTHSRWPVHFSFCLSLFFPSYQQKVKIPIITSGSYRLKQNEMCFSHATLLSFCSSHVLSEGQS